MGALQASPTFLVPAPRRVEQLYTETLLRAAFADWELLRIQAYERELDEGEGHKGRSAVIDMIARRPEE